MNLAIHHFAAGLRTGGGKPVYSRMLSQALAKRCDATLYTGAPAFDFLHDSDVEVVELSNWPGHRLHEWISTTDAIRLNASLSYLDARRDGLPRHMSDQDLVITHKWYEDLVVSRTAEPPVAYQRHALGSHGLGGRAHDWLATPEWTMANSDPTKRALERERGAEIDGIVRPGVDIDRFNPVADSALETDDPLILFVGRFEPVKGVETLLEAFAPLSDRARLLYLGDGSKRSTLEARTIDLGIEDAVEVNGVVPHEDIHRYYAAADVVCHPSRYEGFGMTNLEAMASGKPLVTTPFGFVDEFGTRDETHLEVPPGNPAELSRGLEMLLDDPERRASLGENARDLSKDHTWDHRAAKMVELCEAFLAEYE